MAGPVVQVPKQGIKRTLPNGNVLEVTPIGAGGEVGRSCILVKYQDKTVMFDCGVHPAHKGLASLPFFDEIDPSTIDLLLVSHFHLDHAAAIPYLVSKTTFKGKIYMTHPTKAIYKMLLSDFVRVSHVAVEDQLFNAKDLDDSLALIECINYHQELEHAGIRFWCYNAGHVLGAAMFMVEIDNVKIMYTGDFSREEDRHMVGAETPGVSPDVLLVESTYGVQVHPPRLQREKLFTDAVYHSVSHGGKVLVPVFALGRAQELLLILDEYWAARPQLKNVPIFYASSLAKRALSVYRTFINMMNENIRRRFEVSNPFDFDHITYLKSNEVIDESKAVVVFASPGMLQSGLSRQLFENWCSDERNAVVIPGYSVEGTLAHHIKTQPKTITNSAGVKVRLDCQVHYVSFSAHSDYKNTSEFIATLRCPNVVLVHGDYAMQMVRMKNKLEEEFGTNVQVFAPKNTETVRLEFKPQKKARLVGEMAEKEPKKGDVVSGVMVKKSFAYHMMSAEELPQFTTLNTSRVKQSMRVPFPHAFAMLTAHLAHMYELVKTGSASNAAVKILDTVEVAYKKGEGVVVSWDSNPVTDMVADSVVAAVMQVGSQPGAIAAMECGCAPDDFDTRLNVMMTALEGAFGNVEFVDESMSMTVEVDGKEVSVMLDVDGEGGETVKGDDAALVARVQRVVERVNKSIALM